MINQVHKSTQAQLVWCYGDGDQFQLEFQSQTIEKEKIKSKAKGIRCWTWLQRSLIKRSFGERANLVAGVESRRQATEQPLLIFIEDDVEIRHRTESETKRTLIRFELNAFMFV